MREKVTIEDIAREAEVSTATVSRFFNKPEKLAPATAKRVKAAIEKLDYEPGQQWGSKSTTIDEVAKLANVSKATVSRVLNNSELVIQKTREEVMGAIRMLNYQPNMVARHLRKQETKLIGIILPDISNPFYSQVLKGIEDIAYKRDYNVVLLNTDFSDERESKSIQTLIERRAEGFCFMCHRLTEEKIQLLRKLTIPYVMISRTVSDYSDIPFVNVDNILGAYDATNHLISLGHHRIAMISGPGDDECSSLDRIKGYHQALQEARIPIRPEYLKEGNFTYAMGEKLAMDLMELPEPPTAIFAVSDETGIGALKGVKHLGYRVPEDVSIIGFDNLEMSEFCEPTLSTIAQPMSEMGQVAIKNLIDSIEHRPVDKLQVVLPHQLVVRNSTDRAKK